MYLELPHLVIKYPCTTHCQAHVQELEMSRMKGMSGTTKLELGHVYQVSVQFVETCGCSPPYKPFNSDQ